MSYSITSSRLDSDDYFRRTNLLGRNLSEILDDIWLLAASSARTWARWAATSSLSKVLFVVFFYDLYQTQRRSHRYWRRFFVIQRMNCATPSKTLFGGQTELSFSQSSYYLSFFRYLHSVISASSDTLPASRFPAWYSLRSSSSSNTSCIQSPVHSSTTLLPVVQCCTQTTRPMSQMLTHSKVKRKTIICLLFWRITQLTRFLLVVL